MSDLTFESWQLAAGKAESLYDQMSALDVDVDALLRPIPADESAVNREVLEDRRQNAIEVLRQAMPGLKANSHAASAAVMALGRRLEEAK